jgi:uncharacterized OB-fold protein
MVTSIDEECAHGVSLQHACQECDIHSSQKHDCGLIEFPPPEICSLCREKVVMYRLILVEVEVDELHTP